MKVIVVGAGGTIGSAVAALLEKRHEVVRVSRSTAPISVDLCDPASVDQLFVKVADANAVVCCAASGILAPIMSATDADLTTSITGKMIGQVRLAVAALQRLPPNGVVVLTGGAFDKGAAGSAIGLLVNNGLDAFARAAMLEAPSSAAVRVVHPGWVEETLALLGMDPTPGTPAGVIAKEYERALEATSPGQD